MQQHNSSPEKQQDVDQINQEIEKELLTYMENGSNEEEEEVEVSFKKIIFDAIIIVLLILFIITNVGVFIWKLL